MSQIFLSVFEAESSVDTNDNSTDVIVELSNGSKYAATFYTRKNFEKVMNVNGGEKSKYAWFQNLVIVKNIEETYINMVVNEMIDEGDFQLIFKKLN